MASHHHHCHNTHSTTSCCCCCTPSHQSPPSPSPSPPPPPADPLLQALASRLLLLQPPQSHHPNSPYLKPHATHHLPHQQQMHHQHQPKHRFQQDHHRHQTHIILSSLLNRIDALESSLHHLSSFSSSHHHSYSSLRDIAARTIQTRFRAFLVRRSRTLRHLKDLALIKSSFNTLKSSLSDQTHLNPEVLSHKAMDLLLKLDSIQGGDPMIRDGKRSISRDLVRFLEFVDGVSVKRHELSVKNVRFAGDSNKSRVLGTYCRGLGGHQREIMEKLRDQVENIRGFSRVSENEEEDVELEGFHHVSDDEKNPRVSIYGKNGISQIGNGVLVKRNDVQPRVKKSVSFAENGNVYRVFARTHEPISSEDGISIDGGVSIDDQRELVESLCREVEEIGGFSRVSEDDEEAQMETGGSPQTSDGEGNPRRYLRSEGDYEISGHYQGQNGNFVFSAPVPVKMESRADVMKKRKTIKIVK